MKKMIFFGIFMVLFFFTFIQNINAQVTESSVIKVPQEPPRDICNEINAKMNATLLERLNCAKQVDYTVISFFKEMLAIQQNLTNQIIELKKELDDTKNELNQLKESIAKDNYSQPSSSSSPLTGMTVSENKQNTEKENKGIIGFFRKILGLNK